MTRYRARIDSFVSSLTALVLALLSITLLAMFSQAARLGETMPGRLALGGAVLLVLAIVVFSYRYAPKSYRIDADAVVIVRPASELRIPRAAIVRVTPLDRFLGLSLKIPPGGNSGLFGIYGTFYRRDLGKFRMYARAATNGVVLETHDGSVVIAPEPRDRFVAELRGAS